MRAAGVVGMVALAACPRAKPAPPPEPVVATPAEGISIAMYIPVGAEKRGSLVDDRRYLDLAGISFVLDRIDSDADLQALVIEPLDRKPLAIRACMRERDGERALPLVRCRWDGAPGRRFVRVLHVAPSLAVRVSHGVMVTGVDGDARGRAAITTRYAIGTPSWGGPRAHVTIHDRAPGGEHAPRTISHGTIVLDGGTALLADPERTVSAHVRNVFDGAVRESDVAPTDPAWGRESKGQVHTVLDLDNVELPPGNFDIRIAASSGTRDVIAPGPAEKLGANLRVPLWIEATLHGLRRNFPETYTTTRGRKIVQRIQLSVANSSDTARDVVVEERLRPSRRREITGEHPELVIVDGIARMHVVVPPRGTQQMSLTISYDM